jgi:DMSO reductase family type II enzyme chaperone
MLTGAEVALESRPVTWQEIDLYRFFAAAFGAPTRERFEWLQQPALRDALDQLASELGTGREFPEAGRYEQYEEYEAAYLALFDVGLPAPPLPLVESGHNKSQPAQQVALECALFYDVLGLRVNPAGYPLDHLVTQLEFLSAVRYASQRSGAREAGKDLARLERDFLDRHLLNWLPGLEEKLAREQPPLFWALGKLLVMFLKGRRAALAAGLQEEDESR